MAARKSTTRKSTTRKSTAKKTVILHVWDRFDKEREPVNLRITGEGANKWKKEKDPRKALIDVLWEFLLNPKAKVFNYITKSQARKLNRRDFGRVEVEEI